MYLDCVWFDLWETGGVGVERNIGCWCYLCCALCISHESMKEKSSLAVAQLLSMPGFP